MTLIFLAVVLAASLTGTMTGFGIATILVPVLGLFFPLPQVLLLVGIIHWFNDIWRMLLFRRGVRWRLILLFGLPGLAASYLVARMLPSLPEKILSQGLGIFLAVSALATLARPRWALPRTDGAAIGGGLISGILSGLLGVGGVIRAVFLSAYKLPPTVFLFTAGAIGILIDSARITGYLQAKVPLAVPTSLLITGVIASFIGAGLAKQVLTKLSGAAFRNLVSLFLLLVGLRYLLLP